MKTLEFDNYANAAAAMQDGLCDAAIVAEFDYGQTREDMYCHVLVRDGSIARIIQKQTDFVKIVPQLGYTTFLASEAYPYEVESLLEEL